LTATQPAAAADAAAVADAAAASAQVEGGSKTTMLAEMSIEKTFFEKTAPPPKAKKPKPPKPAAEMSIEERIAAALESGDTSAGESSGMETGQSMTEWDDDDLASLMD
jgi:hypothetical protein